MLNLSREYKLLLRYGGNPLSATHPQQHPPVPLSPFAFSVLGRLSSLQGVADGKALIANIQAVSVKTALKKAQQPPQQSAHPSGHIAPGQLAAQRPQARTPEELAAVARDAENPFWLLEIQRHVQQHGDAQPCRYIIVEDLLHPNSVSRFHFLVKRVQQPAADASSSAQPAAAAAGAGASAAPNAVGAQYRYYIMDLGSLNGLYIDDIKVRHQLWTLLHEGARLRFAPQTKNAKSYIAAFHAADAANELRRRASIAAGGTGAHGTFQLVAPALPQMPLSVKDMHIEYRFTHAMNEAAVRRAAQLNSVVAAGGEINGVLEASLGAAAHPAVPISWGATPIMTAAAATSSRGNGVSPAVGSSAWHQNSALLERQRENDAANQAFYSRFASKGPSVAPNVAAAPILDDDELNAAPMPSNFNPKPSVVSRKRDRAPEPPAAQPANPKRARATKQAGHVALAPAPVAAAAAAAASATNSNVDLGEQGRAFVSTAASGAKAERCSDNEDEDVPIVAPSSSSAASQAIASAPTTSAAAHVSSIFEEFTCGICSDIIYKFAVLDCGHSFCRGCIDEWFKKKKVCPVCRNKHKGVPRQVRSVDNVIEMMVKHNCTPAEKDERAVRVLKADAEAKQASERKAERDRAKVARAAFGAPRMMMVESDVDDSDEAYNSPEDEDEDEADGFLAPEFDDDEDDEQVVLAAAAPMNQPPAAAAAGAGIPVHAFPAAAAPGYSFSVDLAPNARSKCRTCNSTIQRDSTRIKQQLPSHNKYFHLLCFTNSHPLHFVRGRLAGLENLPADKRREAEEMI